MSGPLNTTVMWLTLRQLFARRRIWIAIAFALVPLLFTLVFLLVADDSPDARLGFYDGLMRDVLIGTLLPLAALLFGTTAFGGEIDDGTLIYLLVKPLARWRVVLSKFVVAIASTLAVVIPAVVLPWLVIPDPSLPGRAPLAYLAGAAAGAAIYTALFLALGLATRRALVTGLLYVIGFESILTRSLAGAKSFSVREFALAIAQAAGGKAPFISTTIPIATARLMGTIIFVAAMAWTMRRLVRYEVAERL